MFHHGLISQKFSRRKKGVVIILSLELTKGYHDSGSVPPNIYVKKQRIIRRIHRFEFNISVKRNERGSFR